MDPQGDSANCGACGNACASGQTCSAGTCTIVAPDAGANTCPGAPGCPLVCSGGTTLCSGACVDTKADADNCGACGTQCASGQQCESGSCVCPPSAPDLCGTGATAACTSVQSDPLHCGTCGNACGAGFACVAKSCSALVPPTRSMSLLAGSLGSFGNINGTGTASRFSSPWGACTDGTNLFVPDSGNCVLRRVVIATGETTTLAGTMNICASADGIGAIARFNGPTACTTDGAGNVYVTDRTTSCAIRKVDVATRTVTTISGGICGFLDDATNPLTARYNSPQGIAYNNGNLYIADSNNHAVRRLELASGAVTTFAGAIAPTAYSGATDAIGNDARFRNPNGLAFDGDASNLYVADSTNHTIRRIEMATANVTTVAGAALAAGLTNNTVGTSARFRNPIGLAFDGVNNLYVTEDSNHGVRVLSLETFGVTSNVGAPQVAGYADGVGSGALFSNPRGITFAGAGTYYVSDFSNNCVRRVVAATGTVTTVAGLGATAGSTNGTGAAASFNVPWGLAYDGAKTLYVSDQATHIIRTINLDTGAVTTLAGTAGLTGNVDGTGSTARFYNPTGLALDGNGNLYVADYSNQTIRRIVVATGVVTTLAGSPGSPGYLDGTGGNILFANPLAIAFDGGNPGKLYVSEATNRVVRELDLATVTSTTLAGVSNAPAVTDGVGTATARVNYVSGIAASAAAGKVYLADTNRLRVLDLTTKELVTLSSETAGYLDGAGIYAQFNFSGQPSLLSFDSNGDLLLADYNNNVIRSFSPSTLKASTFAGVAGAWGGRPGPMPTTITPYPRAVVPIKGGHAFIANLGVFVIR